MPGGASTLGLLVTGWAYGPNGHGDIPYARARSDGTFDVAFDAETLSLLFVDPSRQRSGFTQVGQAGSTVELTMLPTATYSGTLLDDEGQPLPGRTLQLDANGRQSPTRASRHARWPPRSPRVTSSSTNTCRPVAMPGFCWTRRERERRAAVAVSGWCTAARVRTLLPTRPLDRRSSHD